MSKMNLNLKRLKHGLKQAKELEEAIKELKNKLDSTIKTVEGQTRIDEISNGLNEDTSTVVIPNRYFTKNTMLFALTLEEAQKIIDLADGVEDNIAGLLSRQSLKQAQATE